MNNNEGITVTDTGAISVVGEDAVNFYAWLSARRSLAFEIRTGMKMTRISTLAAVKRNGWVPSNVRTKQKALDHMNAVGEGLGLDPA